MNFEDAATLPVALTTMHNAVVTNGALQAGQSVLIQGASSGVGLMAMQIARLKGASIVIGSSTDAARRGRLKQFGADLAVDSSDPGWVDQVLQATGGEGVDLIVDQVSGKVASQNLAAAKIKGRIVNVGRLGGTHADFNFDLHAARRISYIGVTFRTRSIEEIRDIFSEVRNDIWPAVESPVAIADRQDVCIRRYRQGVRTHGSQQAPQQDRGDVVGQSQMSAHHR
jgi:NADPH:quinone reductase